MRDLIKDQLLVLIVVAMIMVAGCVKFEHTSETTPLISGLDLTAVDHSFRPQDDFHNHVNGLWLKNTPIPSEYGTYGSFTILNEQSEKNLRTIIEETVALKNTTQGSIEQKIGDYFSGYMDEAAIEAQGTNGIKALLGQVSSVSNQQELMLLFVALLKAGVSVPFDGGVFQDFKNPEQYVFYIGQSGLGLPNREYYLDKDNKRFQKILAAYPHYITTMFKLAGIKKPEHKATQILSLETKLAKLSWSSIQNRDLEKIYNPMDLEQLNQNSSSLLWISLLSELSISDQKFIVMQQPSYFSGLAKLVDQIPLEQWKSYLSLRVISRSANYLSKAFADAHFDFYGRKINGLQKQKARWRRGVSVVDSALGEALGSIYVKKHFPPEAKERMKVLVGNLLAEFEIGIDNLHWMSNKTKAQAKEKLSNFTVKIGYPDKWRNYSALVIDRQDLVGNAFRVSKFEYNYSINKLGKPIDRDEWGMTPQTVNAYYHPTKNEIVFPAAILQPPFFNLAADDAVNYGAIGLVIGHEISHGFDDQGSKFDGKGRMRNWWTEQDRLAFNRSTSMLVSQYDRFSPIEGMNVKGQLTLGENIGDLSGATVALNAYKRSLNGKEAPVIDGYTGIQRFFLGFARAWRTKYREEVQLKRLVTDPHSPPRYRVNGVVPNMPDFYQAFNVRETDGHYLPAEQRVKIW